MTIVRPVVEASVVGVAMVGVVVDNVVDIVQQASGPGVVFGAEAAWQWALVLAAGGILWRAATLVRGIEDTLHNFAEKQANHAANQKLVDERLMERIEANERKWRKWEPVLIEWEIRARVATEKGESA